MEENKLPLPTLADYAKLNEYEKMIKGKEFDDPFNAVYLDFINSFDWKPQVTKESTGNGLKNAGGELIMPHLFEDFKLLSVTHIPIGTRVVAKKNGKWGVFLADGKGTQVLEPVYDEIGYPNPLTYVVKDGKWGVIDLEAKKFLIPVECDEIVSDNGFMFINGIAVYVKNGKYGFIIETGQYTEAIFEDYEGQPEGNVSVKFNGEWGFIDQNNRFTKNEDKSWYVWFID